MDAKLFRKYGPKALSWHFDRPRHEYNETIAEGEVSELLECYQLYPVELTQEQCPCTKCQENERLRELFKINYDDVVANEDGDWPEFEPDQYMICSFRIHGFALEKKIWVQMDVEKIKVIEKKKDEKAFDDVVLPDDENEQEAPGAQATSGSPTMNTKYLIRSLVDQHANTDANQIGHLSDFVVGKGEGLTILLYGIYLSVFP